MVSPRLRALMQEATGAGRLEAAPGRPVGRGRAEHPVCGDEVEVDVHVVDGSILDLRWRAAGCPATHAVAAASTAALVGTRAAAAAESLRRTLEELGGLAHAERHAEAMFLRALQQALAGEGKA